MCGVDTTMQAPKELGRRERDVEEESNDCIRQLAAQLARDKHQVVVMHPDCRSRHKHGARVSASQPLQLHA